MTSFLSWFNRWTNCLLLLILLTSHTKLTIFLFDITTIATSSSGNRNSNNEGGVSLCNAQLHHDRMRHQDEPQLVSFRVLEGVTEPFLLAEDGDEMPAWKLMKIAADEKTRKGLMQQALHEYGQLLKHPYMFGEMPMNEKYDVFLSMANLLKRMGFHQKAELLLYEAMSYSQEPYEAHMQLGLIFLDKEDLDRAKMHMKNCLYYKETDLLVLVHMAAILISEGRIHEAKFYVTRILSALEVRVQKFSFLYENKEDKVAEALLSTSKRDYSTLTTWIEDLLVSVFHGEYTLPSIAVVDSLRMFSHLYEWLDEGEMNGRFVFDLGQSLYEGGRPEIGSLMMHRGLATTDPQTEGLVSVEIVNIRTSLDYPVIADTLVDVIDSYMNMSSFIQSKVEHPVDVENSLDIYWPIPYIYFSALPLSPIINGLNKRFIGGPQRKIQRKSEWLKHPKEFSSVSTSLSKVSSSSSPDRRIAIGIFGGHMNNHPVGQVVLYRVLAELSSALFKITLIATPLIPDDMTKHIASMMHSIVNLPLDTKAAWNVIDQLSIDVMLFPDWQPFPDQQAFFFHSRRIAPVQICLFIRGGSCGSTSIDYYILPDELYDHYKEMTRLFWERHGVQSFSEQVLLIDWKIYTQQSIHEMAQATLLQGTGNTDVGVNEIEGRIFFEGQPVAVYAADPSYCHPLMDEVLFRVMHSCPSLQIIIAVSSSFFSHDRNIIRRMKWGRKLVRRLWSRGGSVLAARIRLLPLPLDDKKLLNLLRTADLMLDPFPIGSVMHAAALALSVGTPVVTMGNGVHLQASKSDLSELRMHLHSVGKDRNLDQTWIYKTMMRSNHSGVGNIPWLPTISPIASFYSRIGMAADLVANNTNDYFNIASRLAKDREYAYHIRVKILESVDGRAAAEKHNAAARQAAAEQALRNGEIGPDSSSSFSSSTFAGSTDNNNGDDDNDAKERSDLSSTLQVLGRSWANGRIDGWKKESYM